MAAVAGDVGGEPAQRPDVLGLGPRGAGRADVGGQRLAGAGAAGSGIGGVGHGAGMNLTDCRGPPLRQAGRLV